MNGRASSRSAFDGSELLGIEPLEEHARRLAAALTVSGRRPRMPRRHLRRLDRQMRALRVVYRALSEDAGGSERPSPAAEWLLDNYFVVAAAARDVRHDLPTAYFKRLPRVESVEFAGQPRVYALATELVRWSAARLDAERMERFLAAFQSIAPLTMGELWAWPSALKLVLVEEVCAHAEVLASTLAQRQLADRVAGDLVSGSGRAPHWPIDPHPAFVIRLLQRSQDYEGASALRRDVEHTLAAQGRSIEDAIAAEGGHQAAEQATMASLVGSLRLVSSFDWSNFFEAVSIVEQVLQHDPAAVYARMDFRSRDRYRHAIEELADPTGEDQVRVAHKSIEYARHVEEATPGARGAHVGYHLIGGGRRAFEAGTACVPSIAQRMRRTCFRWATAGYLGSIALGTLMLVAVALMYASAQGWGSVRLLLIGLLIVVPASELTIQIVQRIVAALVPPRRLPRLEYDALPADARTMAIVPTIIDGIDRVHALVDHLEVQAVGNLDPHVHFAILSDFPDAASETLPGDEPIIAAARAAVDGLNARYPGESGGRFFLFHRTRQWNPRESLWMGWERKRGKIEEFNRLLRGAIDTSFTVCVGDLGVLTAVRYCITLDSDTRLPRDAARELVGISTHPLNRPVYDRQAGRIVEGYGILQPRVSVTFTSAAGSLFARLYAGHTGVDPYTKAVSDTYQDLFGEGSFTGKGLYDVDAFITALEGCAPENALLSHDLFEGLYARPALVSDVELVDEYPSSVLTHARRQHRWIRGDWRILLWLLPLVPARHGLTRNRLPLSLPVGARARPLGNRQRTMLRLTARKTWRYFDTFVNDADNWLPPDNCQEDRNDARVAQRTSPTNIAMGLLSTVGAHDLGYISTSSLVIRLDRTLATLERLERYEGHFLNWYDTATLAPLSPRYVSTVDSGNLAGSLMTLVQALRMLVHHPQTSAQRVDGLIDTADLLARASASSTDGPESRQVVTRLSALARGIATDARRAGRDAGEVTLDRYEGDLAEAIGALERSGTADRSRIDYWARATLCGLRGLRPEAVAPHELLSLARRAQALADATRVATAVLDGVPIDPHDIPIVDDDKEHRVVIVLSTPGSPESSLRMAPEETAALG